jgi:hypothetical protein
MIAPAPVIHHVTIGTWDVERVLRASISDERIAECRELIVRAARDGGVTIPRVGPYVLRVEPPTKTLWASVHRLVDESLVEVEPPIVEIAVATDEQDALELWRRIQESDATGPVPERPVTPWCAVRHGASPLDDPAIGWLDEFERAAAWVFAYAE